MSSTMILRRALLVSAFALLLGAAARADSKNISLDCRYTATVDVKQATRVTSQDYGTYWVGTGGALNVRLPAGVQGQGVQVSFFETAVPVAVESLNRDGEVTGRVTYEGRYLNAYLALPSDGAYRVSALDEAAVLRLSRVQVFSGDSLPPEAQRWHEPEGPVDLLQIVTHPDDELLWFGGLLPLYAGERQMNVLVAYAAMHGALKTSRYNELLDGLWECGVHAYPIFGPFNDFQVKTMPAVIKRWGEGACEAWCTGLIRQYRPKVVVTHDLHGESGHMQHRVVAEAVTQAVTVWCGDAARDPDSAEKYGVYTPQKLYLHRYRENQLYMDWDQPLSAFNGKTGVEVARAAFRRHYSQRKTHYHIYVSGPLDSHYLGLYYTAVGPDEAKDDLFEHVSLTP